VPGNDDRRNDDKRGDAPGQAFDPDAMERARGFTQVALGILLLLVALAIVATTATRGDWTLDRVAPLLAPLIAGGLLCGFGALRLRGGLRPPPARSELMSAQVVDSPLGRFARWIEPYEVWLVFAAALLFLLPGVWTYTLIDPWETHYAEVARRMLAEDDWVLTQWQNEGFRSKPVLTFWLIAASMNTFGVAQDGGFSGELVASDTVLLAVRLPFVICGAFGIAMIWWMLARLVSRRLAWFSAATCATTTFYFMVARQAITDIPMVACVMGAIACFAMTLERGDAPLEPLLGRSRNRWLSRLTGHHVFLAAFSLLIGGQAIYYATYFVHAPVARGVAVASPSLMLAVPMLFALGAIFVWNLMLQRVERRGQVWMFWFYLLVGLSVLAKGPPGLGVVGLVCLVYLVLTGRWGLLRKFEIPRGVVITAVVAVPWHVAIAMRGGSAWVNEYFNHHVFGRFVEGVHAPGNRGTFEYFAEQLGIGMFPWAALIPAALAVCLTAATVKSREGRVRLIVGIWAIAGFALFCISQTKFHHYVLPLVPALSIMVAMLLDDMWRGAVSRVTGAAITAVVITLLLVRDFIGEHEKLIELYIYRYDRPWPSGEQDIDLTAVFLGFGVVFAIACALLAFKPIRRWAIGGLLAAAVGWTAWGATGYMQHAGPHWGMREVIRTYYAERQIHGVDIKYYGLAELADDWQGRDRLPVRTVMPEAGVREGAPMVIGLEIPNVGLTGNRIELSGRAAEIGEQGFAIVLDAREREKIAGLIAEGASARPRRPPETQVRADRLIAWQLYWRGENFWTADEIYGPFADTKTAFKHTDNKAFKKYIEKPEQVGRTFYLITEAARAKGLKNLLPTPRGKETFEIIDTSCNKFTLLRFTL
jgi:4-amino-4-deoxy-L-arabinose transferase-like glycosyltransferase